MTDQELIQALRCCAEGECKGCAVYADKQSCQENILAQAADRLEGWIKAYGEWRIVVLPCKVGDTVYFRTYDCNGTVDLGIQPHKVTAIVGHAIVCGRYTDVGLLPGQYGVSWFLTREAAEKALEVKDG